MTGKSKLLTTVKFLLFIILIYYFCILSPFKSKEDFILFFNQLEKNSFSGFIFILIAVVSSMGFMPISWMKAIGAIYFGLAWGFFCSLLAAVISCSLSFLLARLLGKEKIHKIYNKVASEKVIPIAVLSKNIEKYSVEYIFLLRNLYVVPFTPTNYLLGLTKISFKKYIVVSILGMIPGTFAYTYFFAKSIEIYEDWTQGIIPISALIVYYLLIILLKRRLESKGILLSKNTQLN